MNDPGKTGSESQGSDEPGPPGAEKDFKSSVPSLKCMKPTLSPVATTAKGVDLAKKRLRAFSIQKKGSITPTIPKAVPAGNTTVLIGKLAGAKTLPKPEKLEDDPKRPPKPPKPCTNRMPESYPYIQQKTMAEINDLKRKMELVDLGIPLGLICPSGGESAYHNKAMPTKAMPPIKGLLEPAKVDEIIREAKKARAEGKEFKFDYRKLLPEYENPFINKTKQEEREGDGKKKGERDYRRFDRKKRDGKYKSRFSDRGRDKDRDSRHRKDDRSKERTENKNEVKKDDTKQVEEITHEQIDLSQIELPPETDVNLSDYLVCDSWSLDTDDKTSSPHVDDKNKPTPKSSKSKDPVEILKDNLKASIDENIDSPKKVEKLQPVTDSFKFDIDDDDDDEIDIFDEESNLKKYSKQTKQQHTDSPLRFNFEGKDDNDDVFLESVINEIKHEVLSDDSQDKGLVEYDSPTKEEEKKKRESVTPEIDDRIRDIQSQRSDYSDSYKSESGIKSVDSLKSSESGYKTETYRDREERAESFRVSMEKDMDVNNKMSRSTVDSLETWSFVLKICQPLLFRHDKNKCYKETRTCPKLWYTENPKLCDCVKDRSVVYEELEMCKMALVDRVYASDQLTEGAPPLARFWYPPQTDTQSDRAEAPSRDTNTPDREDGSLDKEYQRFMQAVWPEVTESRQKQAEVSRSTTPVRQERKKKSEAEVEDREEKKKMKMSSEGWSQESEVEEEEVKKPKEKVRKRKRSPSIVSSHSESDEAPKKKGKKTKKKTNKKLKAKEKKRRKKILQKLKEKQKKKKQKEESDVDEEEEKEVRKKEKKIKKKKQIKRNKSSIKKKKAKKSSSSSSSSSSSESDSEVDRKRRKDKKKKEKKKKRKQSTSESTQSEELFDVNILNNIKTERLTDDEKAHKKLTPESPKPKPREIINVKQLQDDFSNTIQVKKEIERDRREEKSDAREEDNDTREVVCEEPKISEPPQPVQKPVPEITKPTQSDIHEIIQPIPQEYSEDSQTFTKNVEGTQNYSKHMGSSYSKHKEGSSYSKHKEGSSYSKHKEGSSYNKEIEDTSYVKDREGSNYNKQIEGSSYGKHEEKFTQFEESYEMYEQMAMAYQSDVASQQASPLGGGSSRRIETVVGGRRGHIACDWRVSEPRPGGTLTRPSRWGLKPGEVNIVLTGGGEASPARQVFHIETISNSNRTESGTGYDEAYQDMYGASDLLQYGDCFSAPTPASDVTVGDDVRTGDVTQANKRSSLDDRIDKALQAMGEGDGLNADKEKDKSVTKSGKPAKRVSFADGYKPGQDSDNEEPPVKKRRIIYGCAWPCPAQHPAHVPLWDCLPPPPPPPGSPPPPSGRGYRPILPRKPREEGLRGIVQGMVKIDPTMPFMPPEPPPGLLAFP